MAGKRTGDKPTWPAYGGEIGEHAHAFGYVSLNYNELEARLLQLLLHYSGSPENVTRLLFEKVPTPIRLQWLGALLEERSVAPKVRAAVELFIAGYSRCTENRGVLEHARVWGLRTNDNALLASKRVRKHGREAPYDLPLEVIRRVADEIREWNHYGGHVLAYLGRKRWARRKRPKGSVLVGPTTLPRTLPLPRRLESSALHIPPEPQSPPQS